jgi:hypothetical protein
MIVLEVRKKDVDILKELMEQKDCVRVVEPSNLDGEVIMQLLIEITKITAPLIAAIVIANMNMNKITIKRNGVNIMMILNKKNLKKTELINELLNMQKEDYDK